MMIWREATVRAEDEGWAGVQRLRAELTDGTSVVALGYTDLVGTARPGDRVLLSAAALARGLGTGGFAFVVAIPDRLPPDPPPGPGHIVKARYTPMQTLLLGVDEQESPFHDILADADDLGGVPVVTADLHSAVPAIAAGIRAGAPAARIVYVMTDGGALPAAFSRIVGALREAGWLGATVTVGQAFGGDYEAVNVHTGLLAARHVAAADVVILAQGPGNLGTGTRWGFSGTHVGEAINAAAVLGGTPVGSLRVSGADPRGRHRGVSHHSLTAYGRVALAPARIVVPELAGALGRLVNRQVRDLPARHTLVSEAVEGLADALADSPVRLSTMGRSFADDASPFLAAAAAGRYAARLIPEKPMSSPRAAVAGEQSPRPTSPRQRGGSVASASRTQAARRLACSVPYAPSADWMAMTGHVVPSARSSCAHGRSGPNRTETIEAQGRFRRRTRLRTKRPPGVARAMTSTCSSRKVAAAPASTTIHRA